MTNSTNRNAMSNTMFRIETLNIRLPSLMLDWTTFIRNLICIINMYRPTTPRMCHICIIVGFPTFLIQSHLNCFVCGVISEMTICHICTQKISIITLAKPWIMSFKKLYSLLRSTCVVVIWHTHAQCSPVTASSLLKSPAARTQAAAVSLPSSCFRHDSPSIPFIKTYALWRYK